MQPYIYFDDNVGQELQSYIKMLLRATYTHVSTSWDLYTRENLSGHKLVVKRVSGTIDAVAAGSYTVTTRAIQHYDG